METIIVIITAVALFVFLVADVLVISKVLNKYKSMT
jgi:hypothetical protein